MWKVFLLLCCMASCQLTGRAVKNTSNLDIKSLHHFSDYKWLSEKNLVKINVNGEEQKVKLNIRSRKDSLIWGNVHKGIPLFLARISKDTIEWIQKIQDKIYSKMLFSFFENKINVPLNLSNIQNLLIGNIYFSKYLTSFSAKEIDGLIYGSFSLSKSNQNDDKSAILCSFISNATTKLLQELVFTAQNGTIITIKYKNWNVVKDVPLPFSREIIYQNSKQMIKIDLTSLNVKIDVPQKIPFKIKKSYKRRQYGAF